MLTILAAAVVLIGGYKLIYEYIIQPPKGHSDWQIEIREDYEPVLTVDLNLAPADSLEMIPGIGPVLAQRIVEYRKAQGYFKSIDSLVNVAGIGLEKLVQIRPYLRITGL